MTRRVLLVTGGRDYADRAHVFEVLDAVHRMWRIDVLVEGAARGADDLACDWALQRKIESVRMPADWAKHGRGAGYRRNTAMAARLRAHANAHGPDSAMAVAFPGGKGTANMVAQARGKRLRVLPCCHAHPLPSPEPDR